MYEPKPLQITSRPIVDETKNNHPVNLGIKDVTEAAEQPVKEHVFSDDVYLEQYFMNKGVPVGRLPSAYDIEEALHTNFGVGHPSVGKGVFHDAHGLSIVAELTHDFFDGYFPKGTFETDQEGIRVAMCKFVNDFLDAYSAYSYAIGFGAHVPDIAVVSDSHETPIRNPKVARGTSSDPASRALRSFRLQIIDSFTDQNGVSRFNKPQKKYAEQMKEMSWFIPCYLAAQEGWPTITLDDYKDYEKNTPRGFEPYFSKFFDAMHKREETYKALKQASDECVKSSMDYSDEYLY